MRAHAQAWAQNKHLKGTGVMRTAPLPMPFREHEVQRRAEACGQKILIHLLFGAYGNQAHKTAYLMNPVLTLNGSKLHCAQPRPLAFVRGDGWYNVCYFVLVFV